jgi:hypothetical protein
MQKVDGQNTIELKRQQNAHEFIMEFNGSKALSVLLITTSVLFFSTHMKIHASSRRYISLSLLLLSMYIGILTLLKVINLYNSGDIDRNSPAGLSIAIYMVFAVLFCVLQVYISYILYSII